MSVYTMEYRCEKEQTVLEIRKKVYEDVLTQALEEESAGDFYQGDRQEYGLTPEECAREAANFHVDNMIYDSIEAGLNVPRKQDKFAFRYFSKIDTKEARHIKDRIENVTKKLNEYWKAHHVKNRKSQLIGCSDCGSKINKEYVKENNCCPVCGSPFYSSTDKTRIEGYLSSIKNWKNAYIKLNGKKMCSWYVHTTHH